MRLHVVGAVYGAKLDWSEKHGGQEPPTRVVRSPKACPHVVDKLDQANKVAPCSNLCAIMLLCYTPQVDAWRPMQASHLLEGPISLRRNWNHRFLTLESDWDNKMRHACVWALIRRLASDMLPPDISMMTLQHLAESQTTGSEPQEGEFSLAEGNNMLLSEMFADEVWPWNLNGYDFPVDSVL